MASFTARNKAHCVIFIIIIFSFILRASYAEKLEISSALAISIPVNENILLKTDPYFVALKRAYKAIEVEVTFIVIPGARSIKMLERGKIAGNYPRFEALALENDNILSIKSFVKSDYLFAYSLTRKLDNKKWHSTLLNSPKKIGSVRGIKVLEQKFKNKGITWFNHIDHLIGALTFGRVDFAIESPDIIARYQSDTLKLYRSVKPVYEGKLTHLLHSKHQDVANKLEAYFATFKPFPISQDN